MTTGPCSEGLRGFVLSSRGRGCRICAKISPPYRISNRRQRIIFHHNGGDGLHKGRCGGEFVVDCLSCHLGEETLWKTASP